MVTSAWKAHVPNEIFNHFTTFCDQRSLSSRAWPSLPDPVRILKLATDYHSCTGPFQIRQTRFLVLSKSLDISRSRLVTATGCESHIALLPNDPYLIAEFVLGGSYPIDHDLTVVFVMSVFRNVRNVSGTLMPPMLPQ